MARRRRFFTALISTDWRVAAFIAVICFVLGIFAGGSKETRDQVFGFLSSIGPSNQSDSQSPPQPVYQPGDLVNGQIYQIDRIVDGDTIRLVGYKESVRLIGADTPETVHPNKDIEPFGPEATTFTKNFFAGGTVRIETDGPARDKFRRHLAHLWVGDRELGMELVRNGLAEAMTDYPFSQEAKDRLLEVQAEAQSERRGIWTLRN